MRNEHANEPWTIVRPVISFSDRRLDLFMYSGDRVLRAAERGEELLLPRYAREYSAGIDWAGNSGKLIANLLFKLEAMGETFTVYSGHGLTWGEVADAYRRVIGLKVRWCEETEYLAYHNVQTSWAYLYDRRFNRDVDCTKVLRVTGLTKQDFASVEEGLKRILR